MTRSGAARIVAAASCRCRRASLLAAAVILPSADVRSRARASSRISFRSVRRRRTPRLLRPTQVTRTRETRSRGARARGSERERTAVAPFTRDGFDARQDNAARIIDRVFRRIPISPDFTQPGQPSARELEVSDFPFSPIDHPRAGLGTPRPPSTAGSTLPATPTGFRPRAEPRASTTSASRNRNPPDVRHGPRTYSKKKNV